MGNAAAAKQDFVDVNMRKYAYLANDADNI